MEMKEIQKSSQIAAAGYDIATRTLRIRFNTGAEYEYANVPPELYQRFLAAESKGKFFGAQLKNKPQEYPFKKVKEATPKEKP